MPSKIKIAKLLRDNRKHEFIIPEWFWKKSINSQVAILLLKHVIENANNPMISYKQLGAKISPEFNYHHLLGDPLGRISEVCKENALPYLSGVVINETYGIPGPGFFEYFYGHDERSWDKIHNECMANVISCRKWPELLKRIEMGR